MGKSDFDKIDISSVCSGMNQLGALRSIDQLGLADDFIKDMINKQAEMGEQIAKSNKEKLQREIENNESLKQIMEYNKSLVDYNEALLKNLTAAGRTLDIILNAIGANAQKTQQELIENNKLLAEFKTLVETDEDGSSIKKFLYDNGINAAMLITQLLSMTIMKGAK